MRRLLFGLICAALLFLAPRSEALITGRSYAGGVGYTGIPTIASVTLDPSSPTYTTGASSGTDVTVATANMEPPGISFSGSYSLSGANDADFTINASTGQITTNADTPTCSTPTAIDDINVVATQAGAIGSPYTQAITITCEPSASAAWVQGNDNGSGDSVTLTAVKSGDAVCMSVWVGSLSAATTVTMTDNESNTYTTLTTAYYNGGMIAIGCHFDITNGPTSFTSTSAAGVVDAITADEFSGVTSLDSGTPYASTAAGGTGTGTNDVTSGTYTTSTNGDMLWAVTYASGVLTAGTGSATFTLGISDATNDIASEYGTQATASASTAGTFTQASSGSTYTASAALLP